MSITAKRKKELQRKADKFLAEQRKKLHPHSFPIKAKENK